jgi:hypothetical protein
MSVQVRDLGLDAFVKNSREMSKKEVRVGLFQEDGRSSDGKHTISKLGYINETVKYGLPEPRSFMKITANRVADKSSQRLTDLAWEVLMSNITLEDALSEVGDEYADEIKKTIDTMDKSTYGNTPATLAIKDKKGQGSKPLIATGKMRDSVRAKVMGKPKVKK